MDAGCSPDAPFPLILTFSLGEKEREADAEVWLGSVQRCSNCDLIVGGEGEDKVEMLKPESPGNLPGRVPGPSAQAITGRTFSPIKGKPPPRQIFATIFAT